MLRGKKIIIGISGGIAAYKSIFLIRLLKKKGAEVKVVTTSNAHEFVTFTTLEAISGNKVYSCVFSKENDYSTEHVSLTDWGEVFIVAPATANIIGKYANGIADDALSTSLLAFNKPVFIAPSMNVKMYENFSFQRNLNYLIKNGIHIIEPSEGYLACGYEGKGRMEEPENIVKNVETFFSAGLPLKGKTAMVTAGPTFEPIDPVRFIGNHSSGKMGFAIAEELASKGAHVTLITGPVNISLNNKSIKRIDVVTANEMSKECKLCFPGCDITVMAAAVADYTPKSTADKKIKKNISNQSIVLKPTTDILAELGKIKRKDQLLVGFALETDNELPNAILKLQRKNLDFIVLNSLKDSGAGFGGDTNKITIIDNKSNKKEFELKQKTEVAKDIVYLIAQTLNKKLK